MDATEIQERVVKILTPYVKDQEALANVGPATNILDDLKVNSARLVDVVLAFEDDFDIEIADGRHALAVTERRFDLITSDPIHPWTRGSSALYALEHFQHRLVLFSSNAPLSRTSPFAQDN